MSLRNENIRLEEDDVPAGLLSALILFFVVAILAGTGWAWILFNRDTLALGGLPPPTTERAPRAIANVSQTMIHVERYGQRIEAEQRWLLDQRGWINREARIVRIPIDEAIEIIAREGQR